MTLVAAALLGIIQGLTEFLPVSSSAHLILARAFFGWDTGQFGLAFDVACHLGTLAAVVLYFWNDLVAMGAALPAAVIGRNELPARRLQLIAIGTVPALVAGALWVGAIERHLRTPLVAAISLTMVALAFLWLERTGGRQRTEGQLSAAEAAAIGCAQAAALVPGVSRSGASMATAMAFGLRRDEAARFSFLLGVPAILGAAGLEGLQLARRGVAPGESGLFLIGVMSSAVVGYLTIKYFLRYVIRYSLVPFAWYRLMLAAGVVVWWLLR